MNKKIVVGGLLIIGVIGFYIMVYKRFMGNTVSTPVSEVLRVGTAAGYAPFVSVNPQGEYEGFDIDVAQALAQQLGRKLEIKDYGSMAPLFMALEQGSIDVIMWALSITQDRLKKVAMVRYQGADTLSYPLLFWGTIPENIRSITDMQGKTICVEPASAQESALSKYSFIYTMPIEKVDDALLALQYKKADAAFVEPAIAKKFKKRYPEIQILEIPLDTDNQVHGMGIALKKHNKTLIERVERAVNELSQAGTIKLLEKKWDIPA